MSCLFSKLKCPVAPTKSDPCLIESAVVSVLGLVLLSISMSLFSVSGGKNVTQQTCLVIQCGKLERPPSELWNRDLLQSCGTETSFRAVLLYPSRGTGVGAAQGGRAVFTGGRLRPGRQSSVHSSPPRPSPEACDCLSSLFQMLSVSKSIQCFPKRYWGGGEGHRQGGICGQFLPAKKHRSNAKLQEIKV